MTFSIYRPSLALFTDLYEITMSYGYWKEGLAEKETVFHHFFRRLPFEGGFVIASGLESLIQYLQAFVFSDDDLDYLREVKGNDAKPLFEEDFLNYLKKMTFTCHVDAIPEGTPIFPYEPIVRLQGPLIQCQILEGAILNLMNFPSLIATKAARLRLAAGEDLLLEFGMRRAQGIDGAVTAARAAYVGGCNATSNVFAAKTFGIPAKGTHAHSWVMLFDDEIEAFRAYARSQGNNCIFLVDTYNTLEGVKKAIEVAKTLRQQGQKMIGIRLDSGDLAYLSIESRKLLDAEGFEEAVIMASNELDEKIIYDLKLQGAKINVWGVGTNLVTAKENPALDGVYKLSAVKGDDGEWKYKVKLSEQMFKVSNPGILQIRRFFSQGEYCGDAIYDIYMPCEDHCKVMDPFDASRSKIFSEDFEYEDLLQPIFRKGHLIYNLPSLEAIRERTQTELGKFHQGIKRFIHPHQYVVGMEEQIFNLKMKLVKKARASH